MPGSDADGVPAVSKSGIYPTQYTGGPAARQPASGAAKPASGTSSSPSPGLQVNSDGVRAQAAALAQCAGQAARVLDRLRGSLEAGGMPWGTDDMGKTFGHQYTGPANQGFASIAGIPQALVDVANELAAQAHGYDAIDRHAAEAFNRTGRGATSDGSPAAGS